MDHENSENESNVLSRRLETMLMQTTLSSIDGLCVSYFHIASSINHIQRNRKIFPGPRMVNQNCPSLEHAPRLPHALHRFLQVILMS